ncbi:MAG TPA: efflux transporter outer membrane subunit, partial [Luteimonas sp.]|nr:efflux transporter outer membrane subunit [Luteimonas sp.]
MRKPWQLPALATLSLALAACAVGPDFVKPTTAEPAQFARAGAVAATPAAPVDTAFWHGFNDPLLSQLVDDALDANHDLRIALARYDGANALLRGAKFDYLPTITGQAEAADSRASADQLPGVPRDARDSESYNAAAVASWELDVFGRVRRGVESSRAEAAANAADLAALQVTIVGDVARSYLELRGLQERLRVAQENAANQQETLRLVEARYNAGRGTEFDTSRARAQLEGTLANVPALEAEVAVMMHRIAVLTGKTPDALIAQLQSPAPLPALPTAVDAGTPGDLLRRRPDVAAAEQRLHAATARIGVATADLFPRFTLGGLIGSQAIDSSALF